MTFAIQDSVQQAIIAAAYQQALTDPNRWDDFYRTVYDVITVRTPSIVPTAPPVFPSIPFVAESPIAGVNPAVWLWIRGAVGVNSGDTVFGQYIRDYTALQYKYRTGTNISESTIQVASNAIAANFGRDLVEGTLGNTRWHLPNLDRIGIHDAAAAAAQVFKDDASSTQLANPSPWAGTVLFANLGDASYFNDWILNLNGGVAPTTVGDVTRHGKQETGAYDLFAAAQVTLDTKTVWRAVQGMFNDPLRNKETLDWVTTVGSASVASARGAADVFMARTYGEDAAFFFQPGRAIFDDLYGTLFDTGFKIGTVKNDLYVRESATPTGIRGTNQDEAIHGGAGDDGVVGSAGSDLIDGGDGTDLLTYEVFATNHALRVTFDEAGHWDWRATIVKVPAAAGGRGVTQHDDLAWRDLAYNIELLTLGAKSDSVNGSASVSVPGAGLTIDMGAGVDFSRGKTHGVTVNGGEDSDMIDARPPEDGAASTLGGALLGGDGADYVIATAGDTVDGGAGNDYLEADGAGRVTYVFGRGSGHDVLGTPFWTGDPDAFSDRREDVVHLVGLTAADLELVWAFTDGLATLDDEKWISRFGEAALRITATGETFYLGELRVVFHNPEWENPGTEVGYAVVLDSGEFDGRPGLYQGSLPAWSWPIGPYTAIVNWGAPTQHAPFMLDDGSRLSIMDLFDLRTLDPIAMNPIYVSAFEEFSAGAAGAAIVGAADAPVAGTAGSDLIIAHVSGSVVSAGNGDDEVLGGRGWDSILGGNGADLLRGGAADDTLVGGAGNDTLDGEAGIDRLAGGTGNDLIRAGAGDVVVEGANQGIDTVVGVGGTARTLGANQEVLILEATTLLTGTGNALANVIIGNASANTLSGLAGDDRLEGLDGADLLVGGAGSDTLDGGAGADRFRFVALADSTVAAPDLILGFRADATSLSDRIDLRTLDADPVATGDQAFVFIGAAAFNGTRGALRFDAVAGGGEFLVSGDVDGDGAADVAIRVAAPSAPLAGWFLL